MRSGPPIRRRVLRIVRSCCLAGTLSSQAEGASERVQVTDGSPVGNVERTLSVPCTKRSSVPQTLRVLLPPGYRPQVRSRNGGGSVLLDERSEKTGPTHRQSNPWECSSVHRWGGFPVVVLRRDNPEVSDPPKAAELPAAPDGMVDLLLFADETGPVTGTGSRAFVDRLKSSVANPEMLGEWASESGRSPVIEPGNTCEYLVITSRKLASAFEPWIRHQQQAGLHAEILTTEQLESSGRGRDLPERIRNGIADAFQHRNLQWVLLGGDVSNVPTRMASVPQGGTLAEGRVPADLYYACLDGSWNRDGDDRWGESTDGEDGGEVDLVAEVEVGRAPVATPEEVAVFISKNLAAKNAPKTPSIATVLLGGGMGSEGFEPVIRDGNTWDCLPGWQVRILRDAPRSAPAWTGSEAVRELNESPAIVVYNGHGESDQAMRLGSQALKQLRNPTPFLFSSIACDIGWFDRDAWAPPSMAEALVTLPMHGAYAAVVNARSGWFDRRYPGRYSAEFQDGLLRRFGANQACRLGQAVAGAREALLPRVERRGFQPYRACYLQWTLLGDPRFTRSMGGVGSVATSQGGHHAQ